MDTLVDYQLLDDKPQEGLVRELLSQIERFEVALNNINHGVCFFDGRRRLILANRRYAEIYQTRAGAIAPGMTLEEVLDLRFAAGTGPDMTREDYLAWRASIAVSDRANDTVVELKSGQTISIHHRPMADGGWVATHDDITDRHRTETRLAHMARHDALTGLMNRTALRELLEQERVDSARRKQVAVLCLDLDNFKQVNDLYGHAAGDALLIAVTNVLRENIRSDDIAFRLGGDEFAIIQRGDRQPGTAVSLARRVIEMLTRPFEVGLHSVLVGTSVGIAYGAAAEADPERLLRNADIALYRAKADGRGTYRLFEADMSAELQSRYVVELGLRSAIANSELELFFQPILNTRKRTINRFEALVRWRHPQRGLILPSEFIPLAEETGTIIPLGEWVIHEACRNAATWPSHIGVAVNLSPLQFRNPKLIDVITEALRDSRVAPERVEFEITETALLKDTTEVLDTLQTLRKMGVRISLDDFGTGYSSIGYLRKFPFTTLKIDQSFVRDLGTDANSTAIVSAIIGLGKTLGMSVIAEGVETDAQLGILRGNRCPELQGYFFSTPVPATDVHNLMDRLGKQ